MPRKKKSDDNTIAVNRKALHDYTLGEQFEAGLVLEGWEVKSLRAGKAQLVDSYIIIKSGEAYLFGAHISPLLSASTHVNPDPARTRKLLLNRRELNTLIGAIQRKGFTAIALSLYWKKHRAKLKIALAKGKKTHDKRRTVQQRDWNRQQQRLQKKGRQT